MLIDYLPIVVMAALAVAFGVVSMVASRWFRPNRPNPVKLSAYECGNDPVRLPRGEKFSVKFYVVAMLFIIFDVETIFLFPWAVSFRRLGLFGLDRDGGVHRPGVRGLRLRLAQGRAGLDRHGHARGVESRSPRTTDQAQEAEVVGAR